MLKKTPYFEPYKNGKTTLPGKYTGQSGVYFIKPKGRRKPVYIGSSDRNLKKTIYRHFQEWTTRGEQRYDRTIYPKKGYEIKVIYAPPGQAFELEKILIQKINPSGNPIKYRNLFTPESKVKKYTEKLKEAEYESAPF